MDGVKVAEHLLKNIRQDKADYTQRLADGAIEDLSDYRFMVGQIRGLTQCEDHIKTAMKGIDLEDG